MHRLRKAVLLGLCAARFGFSSPSIADLAGLPLAFERAGGKAGQTSDTMFLARPRDGVVRLKADGGMQIAGYRDDTGLTMSFVAGNPAPRVEARKALPGRHHYLIGGDPHAWVTDMATFGEVVYHNLYPGVSLVYYGTQARMEYDFMLDAGVSPGTIRMGFRGATVGIDDNGELVLRAAQGEVRHHRPRVYQPGGHTDLPARYVLLGEGEAGFEVDGYDPAKPLVIDPVMSYASYIGGSGDDRAYGITVDASGCAYITGETWSTDFPVRPSPYQPKSSGERDVFVIKLNPAGNAVVYATYIGGGSRDVARAIAVDTSANAVIAGYTYSRNFPVTVGVVGTSSKGLEEAFIVKLNASGSGLVYSTLLGGTGSDFAMAVAVNAAGEAYAAGYTSSLDFPTTAGAASRTFSGGTYDAFVVRINAFGSSLLYSTYIGGTGIDTVAGMAIDGQGNAYVAGYSDSPDLPVKSATQAYGGGGDALLAKIGPAGQLLYATWLGGRGADQANAVAVDSQGAAYICGSTLSSNFPVSAGSFQTSLRGGYDAFVAKVAPGGGSLVFASLLGGSGSDEARSLAVTGASMIVGGYTTSLDFPVFSALQTAAGNGDGFVAVLDTSGKNVQFSTYIGGSGMDSVESVAASPAGDIYAAGYTFSTALRVWASAAPAGGGDAFAIKLTANLPPLVLGVTPNSGSGNPQTFTINVADPNSYIDIDRVTVVINAGLDSVASCTVTYYLQQNKAYLFDDASVGSSALAPGTAGMAGNSQCELRGTGLSVSGSTTNLSLTLPLTFRSAFKGQKNIYVRVDDTGGLSSGFQAAATWTVPGAVSPPEATAVTPASSTGLSGAYTFTFTDATGPTDIDTTVVVINSGLDSHRSCTLMYDRGTARVYLFNDESAEATGFPAGTAATVENSQCVIYYGASEISSSEDRLLLKVHISFKPTFTGKKFIYMRAIDHGGLDSGFQQRGQVAVQYVNSPPAVSATQPPSGAGMNAQLSITFSDPNGYADLPSAVVVINSGLDSRNSCTVLYDRASAQLYLMNDASTTAIGIRPGVSGSVDNHQCTLSGSGSSVSFGEKTVTLNLALTFKPAFAGKKNVYGRVVDFAGLDSWFVAAGQWEIK